MFSNNNFISLRQLKLLLILDIFGMGITTLPRKMVETGGQNGWFFILIGTFFSIISLFFINQIAKTYPNDSFVEYTGKILGKSLSTIISSLFILKIMISIGLEIRIFSEILKEIMLFNTPFWVISICMLLVCGYMASKGFEARGRVAEILVWIVFIPLAFVFLVAIFDIDFTNLKPVFKEFTPKDAMIGGLNTFLYFSGIQYIFFVYPYVKEKNKVQSCSIKALIFAGILITIICATTIARFGKYDMLHQMWPVLEIMDTINLPGSFIERQDALTMTFWIISVFMITNAGIFFSSLIFKDIIKIGTHSTFICIAIPIIFLISILPPNIAEVYELINIFYLVFEIFYAIILPLLLFLVIKVRRIKNEPA